MANTVTVERSAPMGRASSLRDSDGFHALSPVLYSAACIFRARQSCCSPSMTPGTGIWINTGTLSVPGPYSASGACSPAAPLPWG